MSASPMTRCPPPSRSPTPRARPLRPSRRAACEDRMTTPDAVSASILATLSQTVPQLSCAIGTPERALIDACAAQIAAAYISQYLTGGMMDINTLSGLQLDPFVGNYGFG